MEIGHTVERLRLECQASAARCGELLSAEARRTSASSGRNASGKSTYGSMPFSELTSLGILAPLLYSRHGLSI